MKIMSKVTWIKWLFRDPLPVGRRELVLDVGCGGNPHPRADVLCDKLIEDSERPCRLAMDDRPFIVCDAEDLPFRDKSFDFVISRHTLEHLRKPGLFLKECMRISKRGLITGPSCVGEKLQSFSYYHWFIKVGNKQLIFRQKDREVFDKDLANFAHTYRGVFKYIVGQIWVEVNRDVSEFRYLWKDRIKYRVIGGVEDHKKTSHPHVCSRLNSNYEFPRRDLALTYLRRMIYGQRRFNCEKLLVCPTCKHGLSKTQNGFYCRVCSLLFPIVNNIPILDKSSSLSL